MESKNFDRALDERLIDLVRDNRVLYDLNHEHYKDTSVKASVWHIIGAELDRTADECKSRWRTMRDSYRKNLNKIKSNAIAGSPAIPKSKYLNNKDLQFLDDSFQERTLKANIIIPNHLEESPSTSGVGTQATVVRRKSYRVNTNAMSAHNGVMMADGMEGQGEPSGTTDQKGEEQERAYKIIKWGDNQINIEDLCLKVAREERNSILREILSNQSSQCSLQFQSQSPHPVEMFFKSMSETVQKFPPHLIAETRLKVCQIVTEMEIKAIQQEGASEKTDNSP